jgi:rubredoxin
MAHRSFGIAAAVEIADVPQHVVCPDVGQPEAAFLKPTQIAP